MRGLHNTAGPVNGQTGAGVVWTPRQAWLNQLVGRDCQSYDVAAAFSYELNSTPETCVP
jgi:hypothetical protein